VKVLTILGTRPEIIRLSRVIPALDQTCEHHVAHTGQNFDTRLSDIFFEELGIRQPDYFFRTRVDTLATQVGHILTEAESLLERLAPDRLLVLGDTNSALSAFIAKRMGIPVYHMEAGNRCYDDRVPEEVNRRIIDHCSDVLMPYTERSRVNLLDEGIHGTRILVTGNPINEVLNHYRPQTEASDAHRRLGLTAGRYVLATFHRAENVDVPDRLMRILEGLHASAHALEMPVICSLHPRTRARLEQQFGARYATALGQEDRPTPKGKSGPTGSVVPLDPLGFFDFVALERDAYAVVTDSGTVQEECCIMGVPAITIRDTTERPETVECGSNILAGVDPALLVTLLTTRCEGRGWWTVPAEYLAEHVAATVVNIVLGYNALLRPGSANAAPARESTTSPRPARPAAPPSPPTPQDGAARSARLRSTPSARGAK
jgi:UDP-N-acetylglucosamine 2-epimerase (non-hydrolysing)